MTSLRSPSQMSCQFPSARLLALVPCHQWGRSWVPLRLAISLRLPRLQTFVALRLRPLLPPRQSCPHRSLLHLDVVIVSAGPHDT
ncbi:unnamed protein product [Linum trigynum]|uniref:Uncharacterized protein n=1 Tax=Linum trigynum TaxID=586398 RepID=A0AAV2GIC2_9ROSI